MSDAPPRLRIDGELREALSARSLGALGSGAFARFLLPRRWFGGKGEPPRAISVRDVISVFPSELDAVIARIVVDHGRARAATYQLPLAVCRAQDAPPAPVLAHVDSPAGPGVLFDAVEDPRFRAALGRGFAAGASFGGAGTRWRLEPESAGDPARLVAASPRLGGAEQSNTSICFGDRAILKLYRRLEPGENPDVEITRFLTRRARFERVPAFLGALRFEDADGTTTVAGIVQRFIRASGDGWSHALDQVRRALATGGEPGADGGPFASEARGLGKVTRALHEALACDAADPAFAPERANAETVAAWRSGVERQVASALDLLGARLSEGAVPAAVARPARELVAGRGKATARAAALAEAAAADPGSLIRHHGDYHLGQVLRTLDGDWVVTDFEGEPSRPIAERRRKTSALRDVAGMLRSFAYAAAAGARGSSEPAAPSGALATAAEVWRRSARRNFLAGYFASGIGGILPSSAAAAHALTALFELEKAFYELAYEIHSRPDWIEIPLGGILALLDGRGERGE